jgi:hypothetical protein
MSASVMFWPAPHVAVNDSFTMAVIFLMIKPYCLDAVVGVSRNLSRNVPSSVVLLMAFPEMLASNRSGVRDEVFTFD